MFLYAVFPDVSNGLHTVHRSSYFCKFCSDIKVILYNAHKTIKILIIPRFTASNVYEGRTAFPEIERQFKQSFR